MLPGTGGRAPVVLTRPAGQNEALATRLHATGREVLIAPSLALTPSDAQALPTLDGVDVVVFVSGNAARFFLDRWQRQAGRPWPDGVAAATVGPGSAAALRAHPAFATTATLITPPATAERHDSEALWACLQNLAGGLRHVLIVRGTEGRDWLAERLRESGVTVTIHAAYERTAAPWPADVIERMHHHAQADQHVVWLATSAQGVQAAAAAARLGGLAAWWAGSRFIATHPRIAASVTDAVHVMSDLGANGRAARMLQTCSADDDAVFAAIESGA